jgi:dimethylhistidine N-methyltransferase
MSTLQSTLRDTDDKHCQTDESPDLSQIKTDVISGLSQPLKILPYYLLYDYEGSKIFEEITQLEEYYSTKCEAEIFDSHMPKIADICGENITLVEFGSGSSNKTLKVLKAFTSPHAYVPIDISGSFLLESAQNVKNCFPTLSIHPIEADFNELESLPSHIELLGTAIGFFPGSTIGNMAPETEAVDFMKRAKALLGKNSYFLIGVDLKKEEALLNAAYNDLKGVTAQFNLNILQHINTILSANFNTDYFKHKAFFNAENSRIEMHLEVLVDHEVSVSGHPFEMKKGETIHTENSYKYTIGSFQNLAKNTGWTPVEYWLDSKGYFSLHLLRA